jgi:hypothetical protein
VAWNVVLVDEVDDWFMDLVHNDPKTAELVAAAVDQLEADGPTLAGRLSTVSKTRRSTT